MIVGVPREIKCHEYRVALTPAGARHLRRHGHQVLIERDAGSRSGFRDEAYRAADAEIVETAEEVFRRAELIVKVKEPQVGECRLLREGQVLFAYLHLAADRAQARWLLDSGSAAIAYETVTGDDGRLPLLAPMSEIAGRLSVQVGAHYLETVHGGGGLLLGGAPGVEPAKAVVLGGGVAGAAAARMAVGLGARVTIIDRSLKRLAELDVQFGSLITTVHATTDSIETHVAEADLLIGAVLLPGAAAPKLVSTEAITAMRPGSVVVDVAIDQGGCCATSRPTSHEEPTYRVSEVVHYCVTNMPAAVARTSTQALCNATLRHVADLADKGCARALLDDPHLRNGLNVFNGRLTHPAVAQALGEPWQPPHEAIAA